MKQWIYTTSCWNIRGQSGWNTFSHSRSLDSADISELEKKCQVPSNIGPEYFPIFEVLTLSSGRQVICQTSLQGNSFYDGRPGATITHGFIIEPDEHWPLSPASYFGSPAFLRDLPDEVKKQALYYRDHPAEKVPPEYLAEVPVDALPPGNQYCEEALIQTLQEPETRAAVNAVLTRFLQAEKDEMPLKYRCAPSQYATIMAALYHIVPQIMRGLNTSTLFRTAGSSFQYSFLHVVGTRDSNASVCADGVSECPENSLLKTALLNLSEWKAFVESNRPTPENADSFCVVFQFLADKSPVLDNHLLQALIVLPNDVVAPETECKIGEHLARAAWPTLSSGELLLLAERMMKSYPIQVPLFSNQMKFAWQNVIFKLLRYMTDCLVSGEISADDMSSILAIHPNYKIIWMQDSSLLHRIETVSPSSVLNVVELLSIVAPDLEWLNARLGKIIIEKCASGPILWGKFLRAIHDTRALLFAWRCVCNEMSDRKEALMPPTLEYIKSLPDQDHHDLLMELLKAQSYSLLAADILQSGDEGTSVLSKLMRFSDVVVREPRFAAYIVDAAWDSIKSHEYSSSEGWWLFRAIADEQSPFDRRTQEMLAEYLCLHFRPEIIDSSIFDFASRLYQAFRGRIDNNLLLPIHFVADLTLLRNLPPEQRESAIVGFCECYLGMESSNSIGTLENQIQVKEIHNLFIDSFLVLPFGVQDCRVAFSPQYISVQSVQDRVQNMLLSAIQDSANRDAVPICSRIMCKTIQVSDDFENAIIDSCIPLVQSKMSKGDCKRLLQTIELQLNNEVMENELFKRYISHIHSEMAMSKGSIFTRFLQTAKHRLHKKSSCNHAESRVSKDPEINK